MVCVGCPGGRMPALFYPRHAGSTHSTGLGLRQPGMAVRVVSGGQGSGGDAAAGAGGRAGGWLHCTVRPSDNAMLTSVPGSAGAPGRLS